MFYIMFKVLLFIHYGICKGKITIKLLSLQISSEVYLFSHIKGKKHQQAVRENSSIQGRELSDEEVVSFVLFYLYYFWF